MMDVNLDPADGELPTLLESESNFNFFWDES